MRSPSTPPTLTAGTRLGPYEVLAPIGSGGMGEVYRARDTRLDRLVALKVLAPSTLDRPDARARFEREARIIASFHHPNICALYDVGHDAGIDFLVMQYLEGETLAARLFRGPLPIDEALRYAVQTAVAIDAAHRQGVTHRDLKPSNIMLTKAGAVLLDFGVAKPHAPAGAARGDPEGSTASDITGAGAIVGTVRYMAPEVLEGADADARSDLFSFGAVVYEMVTGRRAFDGDSTARVIASVLVDQPPAISVRRPDAPHALDEAVRTCLAKDPSERWQNAGDLLRHLQWVGEAQARTPTPSSLRAPSAGVRRTRPWMLAAAAGVVLAIGLPMLPRAPADPAAAPPPHLVAVPCHAANDQDDLLAFCNGMTEDLIGKLVRLTGTHRLQVTPQLGGLRRDVKTPAEARKTLGATWVLQAGLGLPSGDTAASRAPLQLEYQLVDARTERALDVQRFPVDLSNSFAAHDSVIAWLIRNTAVELTHPEREALVTYGSRSADAYASYLIGRGYLNGARSPTSSDRAREALERAVQLDAEFAEAHAALGMAAWTGFERTGETRLRDQAHQACETAARLRPGLAEAHICLGTQLHAAGRHEDAATALVRAIAADPTNDDAHFGLGREQEDLHNFAAAEQTYRRAAEQRPDYFQTHVWMANFYRRQAREEDAARAFERAVALVPFNARGRAILAVPFIYLGRYDEAIEQLRASIGIEPSREAYVNWGMTLYRMRRFEEAAATIELGRALGPADHLVIASLARAHYWNDHARSLQLYADAILLAERELQAATPRLRKSDLQVALADYCAKVGRPGDARAHLAQAGLSPDARPTEPHQLFFAALVYHQLGDRAAALAWLERAVYWGVPAAELRAWIDLDGLRADPDFQRLLRAK